MRQCSTQSASTARRWNLDETDTLTGGSHQPENFPRTPPPLPEIAIQRREPRRILDRAIRSCQYSAQTRVPVSRTSSCGLSALCRWSLLRRIARYFLPFRDLRNGPATSVSNDVLPAAFHVFASICRDSSSFRLNLDEDAFFGVSGRSKTSGKQLLHDRSESGDSTQVFS